MKYIFLFTFGVLIGGWISWPGIFSTDNWKCFNEIVQNSRNEKISIKNILNLPPKLIFRKFPEDNLSKFRILSDTCFR